MGICDNEGGAGGGRGSSLSASMITLCATE